MKRREIREHIFKLLFCTEFHEDVEMPEQEAIYLENLGPIKEENRQEILEKYKKILEKTPEIDEILNQSAKGWNTQRMGKAELAILRLAVYEMKYDEEVPVGVAINEAVELAKQFSQDGTGAFVNGILAKIPV